MTTAPEPLTPREQLLFRLLDAYERSSSFGKPAPWRRDMIVRLDADTFSEAFAPDGRVQLEALYAAGEWLVSAKAVRCERRKGGLQGTAITALRLGPEELGKAYALASELGYEQLSSTFARLDASVGALHPEAGGTFMASYLAEIERALGIGELGPLGMRRERLKRELHDVVDALRAACAIARSEVGWERMVSERLFRDTKRLGALRARVANILVGADPRFAGSPVDEDEVDVLAVYGMRRRPGFIVCAGGGALDVNGDRIRLESFVPCAMIPEAWTSSWVQAIAGSGTHTATTIENEYAFHAYVEEAGGPSGLAARGEVAVYIAGFPPRFLADALAQLAQAAPQVGFRHWGDADVGGIRIWLHLRNVIQQPLEVYRTTSGWLRSLGANAGTPLSSVERGRLVSTRRVLQTSLAAGADDAKEAVALIDALLELGFKVEQERM